MLKYNDFLLEKEFQKWEILSETTNESLDKLGKSIEDFINKEYEIDTENFEKAMIKLLIRFKKNIKIITLIVSLLFGYMGKSSVLNVLNKAGFNKMQQEQIIKTPEVKIPEKQLEDFLDALAKKESSGNSKSINRFGYIGKYQFGEQALKDLGLDKITTHKFKKNPKIFPEHAQDKAMINLLKLNNKYLGDYVDNYVGEIISGVEITKSGLLAGAHLVGARAVKEFLDSGGKFIPKDGNGVPVTEYIKKFGGFNLTF